MGINASTEEVIVRIDPHYFRPTEVDFLQSDPSKAKTILNWEPKISFDDLIKDMIESDWRLLKEGKEI